MRIRFTWVFTVLSPTNNPKVQDIDFRDSAVEFEIPVFFVQGAHEAGRRAELFDEWYPQVSAPLKDLAVFETSGHSTEAI